MDYRLSRPVLWALIASSVLGAVMVGLRISYTGTGTFLWLIFPNLLLAWIPLVASRLACRTLADGRRPGVLTALWGMVWLAFYPNCSYIVTDLIHLSWASSKTTLYFDLSVVMLTAMLGWFLGAISLYGLHLEVSRRSGPAVGHLFGAIVLLLGAVGVYLGRVLRWNSWDLATRPWKVAADSLDILQRPDAILFILAFASFTGAVYAVFYCVVRHSGAGR